MIEALINLILQFGELNKQQIKFGLRRVEILELEKKIPAGSSPVCGLLLKRCLPVFLQQKGRSDQ